MAAHEEANAFDRQGNLRFSPRRAGWYLAARSRQEALDKAWAMVWNRLTGPDAAVRDPGQRRQARFLSALLILLAGLVLLAGIVPYVFWRTEALEHGPIGPMLVGGEIALLVTYWLSRTRHYQPAAVLLVVMTTASMFVAASSSATAGQVSLLIYLVVPLLLSSMLLGTETTFVLLLGQVASIIFLVVSTDTLDFDQGWIAGGTIICVLILASHFQQRLITRDREAELRTSEMRYRAVSELSYDFAYALAVDADRSLTGEWVTDAFTPITGYTLGALADKGWHTLVFPEDWPVFSWHMQQRMDGHTNTMEFRIRTADGTVRWLRDRGKPQWDRRRRHVIRIFGVAQDITEQKESDAIIQNYISRIDLLHAIDQSVLANLSPRDVAQVVLEGLHHLVPVDGASVILFDQDTKQATIIGASGVQKTAFAADERLSLEALLPVITLDAPDQRVIDDVASLSPDSPFFHKLQAAAIQSCVFTPLIAEGKLIGLLGLCSCRPTSYAGEYGAIAWELANQLAIAIQHADMREQIQAQNVLFAERLKERTAELERVTERVEAILNNSTDSVILAYGDGLIIQTNATFDSVFGYGIDELFHESLATIASADDRANLEAALHDCAGDGTIRRLEIEARRKDGSSFSAEVGIALVGRDVNWSDMIVCTIHDITPRKTAEIELLSMLEREREFGELRTRFVSMISHELRTPLTTIVSSAELIERYLDRLDESQREKYFDRIQQAATYMTELIDNVLSYGHLESQRHAPHYEPLDLEGLCHTIINEVSLAAGSPPTIAFTSEGDCHNVVLDSTLTRHIVSNLVSNAVKYSPDGGTITLAIRADESGTGIRVSDEGMGIPADFLKHLFEPFNRADSVRTIKGTGLGLTITHRAITLMNGTIRVDSTEGAGTTFEVQLPIHKA